MRPKPLPAWTALVAAVLLLACGSGTGEPAATSQPPTFPAGGPAAGAPLGPTDVRISGPLPDLRTPVPPGQGELNRVTIAWRDNSANEAGFRIYRDCSGSVAALVDVDANTTAYGPAPACRPGRLGVAAFNAEGISAIAWSN